MKMREGIWFWLAALLPRKLVYCATIRLLAFASQEEFGETVVPELTVMEALKRWE
jgi:hypothetical protein